MITAFFSKSGQTEKIKKPSDQLGHNFAKSNSCTSLTILTKLREFGSTFAWFSYSFLSISLMFTVLSLTWILGWILSIFDVIFCLTFAWFSYSNLKHFWREFGAFHFKWCTCVEIGQPKKLNNWLTNSKQLLKIQFLHKSCNFRKFARNSVKTILKTNRNALTIIGDCLDFEIFVFIFEPQ